MDVRFEGTWSGHIQNPEEHHNPSARDRAARFQFCRVLEFSVKEVLPFLCFRVKLTETRRVRTGTCELNGVWSSPEQVLERHASLMGEAEEPVRVPQSPSWGSSSEERLQFFSSFILEQSVVFFPSPNCGGDPDLYSFTVFIIFDLI